MIARYLVEDGNVTGNDGQLVLRGLDERPDQSILPSEAAMRQVEAA